VAPRLFDRALSVGRRIKECNEKVEYIHLNPVRAGLVSRREDWSRRAGSSYNGYAGMGAEESVSRRTGWSPVPLCGIDRVRMPSDPRARI
jgi:hypothetical protein